MNMVCECGSKTLSLYASANGWTCFECSVKYPLQTPQGKHEKKVKRQHRLFDKNRSNGQIGAFKKA